MAMNPPTAAPAKKTNWFLIAAGGASILGLLALVMKNSSGGGTTAAGTSINAALGSLQEEQLNTQGQIGQLSQSIGLGPNETLVGHIDANQAATIGAISDVGTAVAGVGTQVTAAATQEQTNANAQAAQSTNFFGQLMTQLAALLSGQQQAAAAATDNQNATQASIGNLGTQITGQFGALSDQEKQDIAGINSQLGSLSSGQQQLLIGQVLSDVHNQVNFDAVQAGLNGSVNPVVGAHMTAAVNGSY